jgi:hypothetical protein
MAAQVAASIDQALALAEAGEIVRVEVPLGSRAAREWRTSRIEALYEVSFLRLFLAWEDFLEESFIRYMCGFSHALGRETLVNRPPRKIENARIAFFAGEPFVSWYNPQRVQKRLVKHVGNGLHELVLLSNQSRLEWFAAVRHRVAHGSDKAALDFRNATLSLCGRTFRGARPGRFLRTVDPATNVRWINVIGQEFKNLASQIVP